MCFYSGGFKCTYQKTTATLSHTDTTRHNSGVIFIPLRPERTSFPYAESPFILMAEESNKQWRMNSTCSFLRSRTNVAVPHWGTLAPDTTCHCHCSADQSAPRDAVAQFKPRGAGRGALVLYNGLARAVGVSRRVLQYDYLSFSQENSEKLWTDRMILMMGTERAPGKLGDTCFFDLS